VGFLLVQEKEFSLHIITFTAYQPNLCLWEGPRESKINWFPRAKEKKV